MFVSHRLERRADLSGPSLMVLYRATTIPVARGHEVRVLGRMGPAVSGTNAFGAEVTVVSMDAIAVWDVTAGRVGWLLEEEDTYRAWKSGALFAPK